MQNYTDLPLVKADAILSVPTFADLPTSGIVEGSIRYIEDVDQLWTYDGATWHLIAGLVVSVSDTNSIDLTVDGAGDLSAALKLSSTAATAGSVKVANSIVTDGLLSQMALASASVSGPLSSTDWSTFNGKQDHDDDLTAIAALTGPGIAVKTSTDPVVVTWAQRSIAGTANRVGVSNGDGAAGNPTINLDTTLLPSPVLGDAGGFLKTTAADTASWNLLGASDIPNLDAGKITTGTFDIARIPAAALERMVGVADQAARYALTTATVQNGDCVYQIDTAVMYWVIDDTQLSSAAGYAVYAAGTAASVPWSGVTSKPDNLVAVAALTGPGIVVKTSTDPATVAFVQRTITGTTNRIGVSNGDGASGNPTIDLDTTQFPQAVLGDVGKALVCTAANTATWSVTPQPSNTNLTAISAIASNGMIARVDNVTYTPRTITGTTNRLGVSNGDGVLGSPTLDVDTTLLPSPAVGDVGKVLKCTAANTGVWTQLAPGDAGAQAADDDLTAIAALTGPGIAVKTSTDPAAVTWVQRTITGTAGRVSVTDGNGAAGNPTIDVGANVLAISLLAPAGNVSPAVYGTTYLMNTDAARSVALPNPASSTNKWVVVKDATGTGAGTNQISITPYGAEKIDNAAATYTMNSDRQSIMLVTDGTDWFVL